LKGSVKDAAQLIQGKVAGLIIGTPSGDPNAQSQILLRGTATLSTSTQPLILVDGIPGELNTVAPDDIESIDVLKDGSAAAIYGTRGTNGVILIATRRAGGIIEPTITYKSYMSTQTLVRQLRMLSPQEYREKLAAGASFQDDGANTDWVKEITNKTPLSQNHNLTFRGGSVKTNYLVSLNYRDQVGEFITSEAKTFNGRFDVNHSMLNDKLKVNINYISSYNNAGVPFENAMYRGAVRYNPTSPVKNPDGTWFENGNIALYYNPVSWLREQYGDDITRMSRTSGSVIWTPVNGLDLKMLASNEQVTNMNSLGRTKQHYVSTQYGENGEASKDFGQSTGNLLELTALYTKTLNSHNFSALAGYSYQNNIGENGGMFNYNFPAGTYSYPDAIQNGDALSKGLATMTSSKYASNLIGFFGRVTYNYKEKYLLMANLRYEGSSKFVGTDEPWGSFPSVSVGWRISEEDFMKSLSFVDNLKLRAGYGVTGTAPDELFLAVSRLGYGPRFLVNGFWTPGLSPVSNANPYLKWELKKETNLGLDFTLFKGTLNGSVDMYKRKTDGLLYDYAVPSPPNLYPTTKANVGVMENKGIEVALDYTAIHKEKFTWNTSVTYSTNRNKLVSLENDLYSITNPWINTGVTPNPIGTYTHRVEVGQPIGNFWGFKVAGITPDGYWIYEDKDGNSAETVTDVDKKVIGNGLPKSYLSWNNSFRYGNFDLNITMRGAFGFQIINEDRMIMELPGFTTYNQMLSSYDKVFGTAVLNKNVQPGFNSFYVEDGDYWKIDNITLGYNFNVSKVAHFSSARLYISTLNTLVITGYKGVNPEVNQLGLSPGADYINKYPSTRVFTVGLNITFK
jgi:TonB-linked SusC/RagA family outer membrane protein